DENTCFGLSGIGDLIVTGVSNLSRNFTFGMLLGQGLSPDEAKKKIGMTVEGEYTVLSAHNLAKVHHLDLPITEGMYKIIYKGSHPKETFLE
ncbi:NAD(P)H-dependent glycerol-3-phosphate dehydrogenase, partial [Streptomyces scabiei]|uniref:NAD(P)H-dependent glycerol-3-phosphate dehydrogenase n=1 Tax=Streptomyces scabiei TaxID=1930 RepID=UPI0038F817BB